MSVDYCPVCQGVMSRTALYWHSICTLCAYEKSILIPSINEPLVHEHIDETARATGLRELRVTNFRRLLATLGQLKPGGGRLLDVGCAHGWFVEMAMSKFEVMGIEPDQAICAATLMRGLPVRNGYFPQALQDGEVFDMIVFNDVFEHIPPIVDVVTACYARLNSGGYLVINLPSSEGLFYRLSKIFVRLGYSSFFERLWQKGLPSPHVHYFNESNLGTLLAANGFEKVTSGRLPVLSLSGLYTRISYTGTMGWLANSTVYALVALSLPVLRLFPSDIIYLIARKN